MARGNIPDKPADRPKVPEIVELARRFYAKPGNGVGGNLHVVLDDNNLDDGCIRSAIERCREQSDEDGLVIATALLEMTPSQRRRVCHSNLYAYQA